MEVLNTKPDTSPSVLEQLARIEKARRRQETADAIFHGLLLALFVTALVVCAVTFACAAMC